ncbi:MAG TPA: hypothetical protein VFT51_12130, partial [Bacillales bacterium]|nr:hypothetical protein [Bacillales bacterium]
NFYNQMLVKLPMNRKIHLENGTEIHFKSLEARLNINNLAFVVSSPIDVSNIHLAMEGFGETSVPIHEQGTHTARFMPFTEEIPRKVHIQLKAVEYKSNGGFIFRIPGKKLKEALHNKIIINKRIGEAFGTTFYLKSLIPLPDKHDQVGIQLSWQASGNNTEGRSTNLTAKNITIPNPVKGKPAELAIQTDKSHQMTIGIKKAFIKNTKQVTVIAHNLLYTIPIHDKEITVEIPHNKENHPASDSSETR